MLEKFHSRHSRLLLLFLREKAGEEGRGKRIGEREREKGENGSSWATVENYLHPFIRLPSDLACPQPHQLVPRFIVLLLLLFRLLLRQSLLLLLLFFPSLFLVLVSLASLPCVLADSAFPLASCWHAEIVRGSQDFWPKRLTLSHVFSYVPKRFLLDEFLRIPGHAASAMKHSEEGRNSNEFLDGTWYGFGNCVEIKRKWSCWFH